MDGGVDLVGGQPAAPHRYAEPVEDFADRASFDTELSSPGSLAGFALQATPAVPGLGWARPCRSMRSWPTCCEQAHR